MSPAGQSTSQGRIPDRARRIDAACDWFEAEWRAGRRRRIEDALAAADGDAAMRAELLRELLLLELELGREGGAATSPASCRERFPDDAALIDEIFARTGRVDDDEDNTDEGDPESRRGAVPFDLAPGCRVGRYAVLGRLDEGGEALVYRVLHVELGKPFVLKLARRRIDRASVAGTGLAAQGRLLAELDHPGLVPVVDLDIHEGRPFLVMDYVPGLNLAQYAAQRPPTPRRAAAIVADVARVVAFLHGRGIIHQDIKPKNLLIDETGRPRVIDFGQARLRHAWSEPRAEASGGTLAYMSPEQAEGDGERITTRTDVFGLGAVLYELLCGRPPYQAPTLTALGELARAGRMIPPRQVDRRVPRRLEAICLRAMARDPSDRYRGADELERALRRYLRRPFLIAAACALAAALLVPAMLAIAPQMSDYPAAGGPAAAVPAHASARTPAP
jgi:tRNA A-37 threonylcarbamoyl transferase component Bud32